MAWTEEQFEEWRRKQKGDGGLLAPPKSRASGKPRRKGRNIWEDADGNASENGEGRAFAEWLRANKVCFVHIPNEGHGSAPWRAAVLKCMGLEKDAPDYLIFTRPKRCCHSMAHTGCCIDRRGIAIELKKQKGGTVGEGQLAFLERLRAEGWDTYVARGAANAIMFLQDRGIGVRTEVPSL